MTPSALEVRVTLWAEETVVILAVNPMLVVPEATVTDAGTVTAVLLLASATRNPVPGAAVVKLMVQESVPAAVTEALLQASELSDGTAALELPLTTRPPQPVMMTQLPRAINPMRR